MAEFNNMKLTTKGLALQSKAQTGVQLNFTKVQFGDGSLASGEDILNLTALKSAKMTTSISSNKVIDDGTSQIRTVLSNAELINGFYLREVGIFAQDPDEGEILYAYTNSGEYADFIPAGTGNTIVENTFDLIVIVGNASNVTAVIPSGGYVSHQDWEEKNQEIDSQMAENVSQMQTYNLKIGDVVHLLGFYTKGDRANHYRIISSIDDGTGIQLNNGLWANIKHKGRVYIQDLGIKIGASDTESMANNVICFNKLSQITSHGIKEILFPSGYYFFNGGLKWTQNTCCALIGLGRTWKDVNLYFSGLAENEFALETDGVDINNQNWGGLAISHIYIYGNRSDKSSGIKFAYTPQITLNDVLVENFSGHGVMIQKCEDSVFNQLDIFKCGRWNDTDLDIASDFSNCGDDDNPATHYALYLHNVPSDNDGNNMLRFNDCRIEKNGAYPYVMDDNGGTMWGTMKGLHSEINGSHANTTFMISLGGIWSFESCHINNFTRTLLAEYGECYVSNCRMFFYQQNGSGHTFTFRGNNIGNGSLLIGANAGSCFISNSKLLLFRSIITNTNINISNCDITDLYVLGYYTSGYLNISSSHILNATFATDVKNIFVEGGMIENLSDGSLNSVLNCIIQTRTDGYNNNADYKGRTLTDGQLLNIANPKIPEFFSIRSNGGVIWNNNHTIKKIAGWVVDNANQKLKAFGQTEVLRDTTANRPSGENVFSGYMYIDTTLNKVIWWDGTHWIDSTGATI